MRGRFIKPNLLNNDIYAILLLNRFIVVNIFTANLVTLWICLALSSIMLEAWYVTALTAMTIFSISVNRYTESISARETTFLSVNAIVLDIAASSIQLILVVAIEVLSYSFRSVSLSSRFIANICSGHMISHLIIASVTAITSIISFNITVTGVSSALLALETPVTVIIQPSVYITLLTVYSGV